MRHFANLIALLVSDWRERDHKNASLHTNAPPKYGGWLGGSQREFALIADRVEEIHKDIRPYSPKQDCHGPSRCAWYLFSDDDFVERIVAPRNKEATDELKKFILLPRRAREVVLQIARSQYAAENSASTRGIEVVT
jgi:hypothetical protein